MGGHGGGQRREKGEVRNGRISEGGEKEWLDEWRDKDITERERIWRESREEIEGRDERKR